MINEHEFYEGKFVYTERWTRSSHCLSLIYQKLARQRLFNRYIPTKKGQKILDVGCGGGNELFARKGIVTGLDISGSSLVQAAKIYSKTIPGSASSIPSPDCQYDLVVSADVIGHIQSGEKDKTIREFFRVLKPGGRTLHYIEVDSNNPLMRFAKKHPPLYKKHFIYQDGHLGLESIDENLKRFYKAGFCRIKAIPLYKLTFSTDEFAKRFDNEYKNKSNLIKVQVNLAKFINKSKFLKLPINLFGGVIFDVISILLPKSYAGGLFLIASKPKMKN